MEDKIVDGEFMFNGNNLITAVSNDITINRGHMDKI